MPNLKIRLLPVGQGDCILIRFPDDSWGVVDCTYKDNAWRQASEYLRTQSPVNSPVRFVLATHPDADHSGGVPALLSILSSSQRGVGEVFHCGAKRKMERGRAAKYLSLPRCASELKKDGQIDDFRRLEAGDKILWNPGIPDLDISILNPVSEFVSEEIMPKISNDASVVLQITYAGVRVLLAGDIEQKAWKSVVSQSIFSSPHVLKVSHHGAANGHPPSEVLQSIDQGKRWAILSTGSEVKDKPHPDVLKSYWTDSNWTVRCTGWSPECHNNDKTTYPISENNSQYPESLLRTLQHAGRSSVYDEFDTRLGCCINNEITINSDGTILHSVEAKSCDSRS